MKELPRHGFTIFGMKRSETDTFAGHMFTTASLGLLLSMAMRMSAARQHDVVMTALLPDLPVAMTGDVSYDLQESAGEDWRKFELSGFETSTDNLCTEGRAEAGRLFKDWRKLNPSIQSWLVRAAAALDAWEMGVTTPTAWAYA